MRRDVLRLRYAHPDSNPSYRVDLETPDIHFSSDCAEGEAGLGDFLVAKKIPPPIISIKKITPTIIKFLLFFILFNR